MCLIKFVPLSYGLSTPNVDVQRVYGDYARFMFSDWGGASRSFNLDGVLIHQGTTDRPLRVLSELHRNRVFKAYRSAGHTFQEEKVIPSSTVSSFFREAFFKFSEFARDYDIAPPFAVFSGMLRVTGYRFGIDGRFMQFEEYLPDRRNLLLPEQLIENNMSGHEEELTKERLDILWQAFGLTSCNLYTQDATWRPNT